MKRLFIACTPRTGNLWFRKLLGSALGIVDVAAHSPSEIAWDELHDGFVSAMHWHCTPEMRGLLRQREIGVLVTIRHPLDILISILHFSQFEPATAQWLGGEGGSEAILKGANPTDAQFLEYALSARARALFAVSLEWRFEAKAVIAYEELVRNPEETIGTVLNVLEEPPVRPLREVTRMHEIRQLRSIAGQHCWLGRSGLWQSLITSEHRERIYREHQSVFDSLGYTVAASDLSKEEALSNWRTLSEV